MFMQIAIGAIGIGIVLMVGFLIIAQVRVQITNNPPQSTFNNTCFGFPVNDTSHCNLSGVACGPHLDNTSTEVSCDDVAFLNGIGDTQATIFAGFGLVAVGIIVLAAFGLINIFK